MRIVGVSLALLAWVYLAGCVVVPLARGCARPRNPFLAIASGIIVTHALFVVGVPLSSLRVAVLAGLGVLALIVTLVRGARPRIPREPLVLAAFLLSALPLVHYVLRRPIAAWDARSIWFFHAKLVFHGDGLHRGIGLDDPEIAWSHPDYPKLIADLAALASSLAGFWNEHVPKVSIVVLLVGLLVGVAQLRLLSIGGRGILLVSLFLLSPYLVADGYADLWLAGYACLAQAYLVLYLRTGSPEDLAAGSLALLLLPMLKNEGLALAGLMAGLFLLYLTLMHRAALKKLAKDARRMGGLLAVALLPTLGWAFLKARWHLENDLDLFSSEALERVEERWDGPGFSAIVDALVHDSLLSMSFAIAAVSLAFYLGWSAGRGIERRHVRAWLFLPVCTALAYAALLFFVFLATPMDLTWHLGTAASRVALPCIALLILAVTAPTGVVRARVRM